jgi:hypothetical protein
MHESESLVANLEVRALVITDLVFIRHDYGRAIAEAAARVRARVWQVGFAVDKMASGQVFSEYFGFPLPKPFIPPTSPPSSQFKNIREK